MKLPTCWSCRYSFKWKELLLHFRKIECPRCGLHQQITKRKLQQSQVITFIITFFTLVGIHFIYPYSLIGALIYVISIMLIALLFSPFIYEFTDKEEYLF
ncbi:TIGR04104 family putative zinc finger protein [Alteribacter aurantiacus]|uniref:TIGR04104 family putative zinc finger protein n=1 Tax=Alteribacter aurantiacus TaxID=254410 RepID=UPI00047E6EF9